MAYTDTNKYSFVCKHQSGCIICIVSLFFFSFPMIYFVDLFMHAALLSSFNLSFAYKIFYSIDRSQFMRQPPSIAAWTNWLTLLLYLHTCILLCTYSSLAAVELVCQRFTHWSCYSSSHAVLSGLYWFTWPGLCEAARFSVGCHSSRWKKWVALSRHFLIMVEAVRLTAWPLDHCGCVHSNHGKWRSRALKDQGMNVP